MDDSVCPRRKYCGFDVISDHVDCQVERCRYCHKKVFYNKREGRIDNRKYLRDHIRDFCQSTGPTRNVFEEIYGTEAVKRNKRLVEAHRGPDTDRLMADGIAESKDALKIWKRLSSRGFTEKEITQHLKMSI